MRISDRKEIRKLPNLFTVVKSLTLNAQVLFIFRKPKLNASDRDKPIFKLSK